MSEKFINAEDRVLPNQRSDRNWSSYDAVGIAEGFVESDNPDEHVEAWAYLIKTGMCWTLQGWFGRNAASIIESGMIDKKGNIDWDMVDDRVAS